jgi:hypothetical protein
MRYIWILFWQGKGYLQITARTVPVGIHWPTGEVWMCEAEIAPLADLLERARDREEATVPHPSQEEMRRVQPVEKAIGLRGFKKITRFGGIGCFVDWTDEGIEVDFSAPEDVRLVTRDSQPRREFSADEPMNVLAQYILEQVQARQSLSADQGEATHAGKK